MYPIVNNEMTKTDVRKKLCQMHKAKRISQYDK